MDLSPRRLTLLPLFFFVVGWGLFVAGFCWSLSSLSVTDKYSYSPTLIVISRADPSLYPFYMTLVGGPFIALAGSLHALMVRISILNSILGLIAVKLSVIYFVSAGTVAIICARNVYYPEEGSPANAKVVLMLSGTLVQTVCWCIILILSVFYKYRPFSDTEGGSTCSGRHWPFTPGLGRILCIPCVILSAVGWCIYTGGMYNTNPWDMFYVRPAFIIPPLAYLTALLHAGCSGGASTVMGVFASILNMLFLSFMGSYLVSFAMYLYTITKEPDDDPDFHNEHYYERMILAGGAIYLVFWGCILALWPFYHRYPINTSSGPTEIIHPMVQCKSIPVILRTPNHPLEISNS